MDVKMFVLLTSVILLVLLGLYLKYIKKAYISVFAVILILLGSASNLSERLGKGCVKDSIDFLGFFDFNVADFAITVGVIAFLVSIWKDKKYDK